MPGSVFPLGKDSKGKKEKTLMARIHRKEYRTLVLELERED